MIITAMSRCRRERPQGEIEDIHGQGLADAGEKKEN